MPDVPIFLFYFCQKNIIGISERIIWSDIYFRSSWQNLFNTFHSIPITLFCAILAYRFEKTRWTFFFISMSFHSLFDLPLHNDDAHRHFFPITDYRFFSPLSYWDSRHYGSIISSAEFLLVLGLSTIIWRRNNRRWEKVLVGFICFSYLFGYGYAFLVWT